MTTILSRIDRFLAKSVFGPPIVGLCRLTRHSPSEMAGALSILGSLTISWFFLQPPTTPLFFSLALLNIFISTPFIYYAAFVRGVRRQSSGFMRILVSSGFLLVLPSLEFLVLMFLILMMAAEYATMIDTLPPRRKKDESSKTSGRVQTGLRRTVYTEAQRGMDATR